MHTILKQLAAAAAGLLLLNSSLAQSRIEQALQKLTDSYSQEKIYLGFNKDFYVSGETAWFKAIVLEGYQKSLISTSLHVELYNSEKQLISKLFLPVLDGESQGSINLPDSLPEAMYYIRAYTEWMLNFDATFQYIHPLRVYNPGSAMQLAAIKNPSFSVKVFPEGGNFIEGVNTKIAVRLFSEGDLPEKWSGYVIEKSKPSEKIITFESLDPNVASFFLIPEKEQEYQVIVDNGQGQTKQADLPPVAQAGVHLQVNLGKGIVHYAARYISSNTIPVPCFVVGTVNSTIVYKASGTLGASGISAIIPTKDMDNGVLQITVFDNNYRVLAKRLCFIDAATLKAKLPAIAAPDFTTKSRADNSITIFPDTTFDHYSLLISDNAETAYDFYSQLWLNSDFPGNRIYKPAEFFRKDNNPAALDALLITELWQRFNWDEILVDKFPEIHFKPQAFLNYQGTVTVNNQPAANVAINLILKYPDSSSQIQQVQTDGMGKFDLNGMFFENAVSVYYKINDKKINSNNVKLSFESLNRTIPYQPAFAGNGYQLQVRDRSVPTSPEIAEAMLARDSYRTVQTKIRELETIVVKGKKKTPTEVLNEQLSTPMYRRNNEILFDLVNDNKTAINYQNIIQFLNGRVPGLQVVKNGADWVPIIRGRPASIYVDEMLVEIDMISGIAISDIAMVKVTRGVFAGTSGADANAGSGVVLIYTHRNGTKPAGTNSTSGLNNISLAGFSTTPDFPLPDYANPAQLPAGKDTRRILYWNPYWRNDSGTAEPIHFYNNDDLKKLHVIVIGFPKSDSAPAYLNHTLP